MCPLSTSIPLHSNLISFSCLPLPISRLSRSQDFGSIESGPNIFWESCSRLRITSVEQVPGFSPLVHPHSLSNSGLQRWRQSHCSKEPRFWNCAPLQQPTPQLATASSPQLSCIRGHAHTAISTHLALRTREASRTSSNSPSFLHTQ